MRTIPDIIGLWPSGAELARRLGLEPIVVQRWRQRRRIPGEYDLSLVNLARADGIDLSFEDLAKARSDSDHYGQPVDNSQASQTCNPTTEDAA